MVSREDIRWFKETFGDRIRSAVEGTVLDVDMLTAIACQETGHIWAVLRRKPDLTPDRIAALCCGDTLDADKGRRAFPRDAKQLLAMPRGQAMFDIARAALLAMADHVPGYAFAHINKKKFCHGFGIFQYDLQFFLKDLGYFLEKKYETFENSLDRALGELRIGLGTAKYKKKSSITDTEFCHVAICYNTGGFVASLGLKQGHKSNGKHYGEYIDDYLALVRTVPVSGGPARPPELRAGEAPMSLPVAPTATGPHLVVDTMISTLRLRSAPHISKPPGANVIAELPDGHPVRAVSATDPTGDFREIETVLGGRLFRGYAAVEFLRRAPAPAAAAAPAASAVPAAGATPTAAAEAPAIPAARLSHRAGSVTRRTAIATAHALNETGAAEIPVEPRLGTSVDEVRANDPFRWLRDFGAGFGWRRAASTDELQEHANLGGIALIVAHRKQDGRSGHNVMVVPETADETAKRDAWGRVTMPLQSQAGAVNSRYGRSTLDWWKGDRFAESAFWIHA